MSPCGNVVAQKVLWINPLGLSFADDAIAAAIRDVKAAGTLVDVVSLSTTPSPHDLEYRSYAAVCYGDMLRAIHHASLAGFDAAVIGCFLDPILDDLREVSGDMIVVGPCQASLQLMSALCSRFSVVVAGQKEAVQTQETIHRYGYGRQLASVRAMQISSADLSQGTEHAMDRLVEAARLAIDSDFAEGIIIGCTLGAGLHRTLQSQIGVPVVDCVEAAFSSAEYFARGRRQFGWTPSRMWSCAPPPADRTRESALFGSSMPIGNRIVIV